MAMASVRPLLLLKFNKVNRTVMLMVPVNVLTLKLETSTSRGEKRTLPPLATKIILKMELAYI